MSVRKSIKINQLHVLIKIIDLYSWYVDVFDLILYLNHKTGVTNVTIIKGMVNTLLNLNFFKKSFFFSPIEYAVHHYINTSNFIFLGKK